MRSLVGRFQKSLGSFSFYKEAMAIAFPVILQQLIMNLASLVDNFMVAGLGDVKMAGVNVANQINFVYFVILWTLCGAGGIYMSQYRGAKNEEGMKQAFRFKLIFSLLLSSIYLALCVFIPEQLLGLMVLNNSARDEIIKEGAAYLRIVSLTWIPIAISASIGTAFRDIGKTKESLILSFVAAITNTILNLFLIYGLFGAPRLEVAGAAIATVVARFLECGLFIVLVRKRKEAFYVPFLQVFKIDAVIFKGIISKSGMMLVSETSWVMTETVTAALYNGRGGAEVVAGLSAGWGIANLFFLVFPGIHTTIGVIVGSTLGANKLSEARDKARWLMSGSFLAGFVVSICLLLSLFAVPLLYGNLTSPARYITNTLLLAIALYMPMWTLLNAQFAVSRSGGDTKMGAILDIGLNFSIFIPGAFLLAFFTPIGPVLMFTILKTSDLLKAYVAHKWLKKEYWLKNLSEA